MKICVLNGSPKGKYSITLQTVLYLAQKFPTCSFEFINVGQRIKSYERDMSEALDAISRAELLLFCYPVYTFIAPYQLHRFIELLKEANIDLGGKYAAQISTSKHFYDVTAHQYIRENCHDLQLRYLGGLSADMDDLLSPKGRADAEAFWKHTLFCAQNGVFDALTPKMQALPVSYEPLGMEVDKRGGFDTVIVTNREPNDDTLAAMISDFDAVYPFKTRIVNIAKYPFKGGCLGCFGCAADGRCVYKDGFDKFLREEIQTASAIVYAFSVKDHSMGASFKQYDDRQFCNGHRTVTMGMPMGYLICGDYSNESNLRLIIEGRCQVGQNFLAGCATDGEGVRKLAKNLSYALENKYVPPQNFLGVGGMKIFRDLIYLMRGLMKADHKFYKKHGIYDFPHKKLGTIIKMKLLGALVTNPKIKAKMGNKMNEGMIAPYQKVIEKAKLNDFK
ncbi:MAG: NAD(P)H-dependent oxidoreductase [Eubacteriales bacterium]|nr:NAD(P)H-dependent oxidoreductase [Eubacteriales bacterium]